MRSRRIIGRLAVTVVVAIVCSLMVSAPTIAAPSGTLQITSVDVHGKRLKDGGAFTAYWDCGEFSCTHFKDGHSKKAVTSISLPIGKKLLIQGGPDDLLPARDRVELTLAKSGITKLRLTYVKGVSFSGRVLNAQSGADSNNISLVRTEDDRGTPVLVYSGKFDQTNELAGSYRIRYSSIKSSGGTSTVRYTYYGGATWESAKVVKTHVQSAKRKASKIKNLALKLNLKLPLLAITVPSSNFYLDGSVRIEPQAGGHAEAFTIGTFDPKVRVGLVSKTYLVSFEFNGIVKWFAGAGIPLTLDKTLAVPVKVSGAVSIAPGTFDD